MRVGFLQFEPRAGQAVFNLRTAARVIGDEKFDLLVMPELCNTGYLLGSRQRALELAEPIPGGASFSALVNIAAARNAHLVAGLAERDGDRVYNTAVLVGPQGLVQRHRKVHLTRYEDEIFDRGDRFDVADVRGDKIGIAISFELWMPEACRQLARRGADILACPANSGGSWSFDLAPVRAFENVVFVVMANRIGVEERDGVSATFRGGSQIVECEGEVIYQAGKEECIATAELDPVRARVKSNLFCADLERELAMYKVSARGTASNA